MSNKKRIAKKVQQLEAFSFRRKFKIAVLQMIKFIEVAKRAKIASQPRKQFPEGRWNPPLKNNGLIVGENCPEFIVDQYGNRTKIHLQKSSNPDVLSGTSYKHIFMSEQ